MRSVVASNYGEALFELAKEENTLNVVKEELLKIADLVRTNDELNHVMTHPKIVKDEKKTLIKQMFNNQKLIENFLMFLVDQGRFGTILDIVDAVVEKVNEELGIEIAYVKSAVALSKKEQEELKTILSKKINKQVELICEIDETCVAGMRVQIQNEVIDNTIATKLENIKERVASVTLSN